MRALINTNTPLGFVLLEEIRPRLPIPLQSASYVRSHFLSSRIAFILLYTILGYLNLIFFFFKWLSQRPFSSEPFCPAYSPRKSGGPVLTSRVLHSTALFCSELALLPKAEINQSWLRLSRNKSRPVQNWSLPSQNVIAWLSLRIN